VEEQPNRQYESSPLVERIPSLHKEFYRVGISFYSQRLRVGTGQAMVSQSYLFHLSRAKALSYFERLVRVDEGRSHRSMRQ
jgi:hypothetical protein